MPGQTPPGYYPGSPELKTEREILAFFENRGLSHAAAAGIVGNLKQESSLNVNAPNGGIDQGLGERANSGNLSQQLGKIWTELQTTEKGTLAKLKTARTPQEAARIFSEDFERPKIPMLGKREQYAKEAAGQESQKGSSFPGASIVEGTVSGIEEAASGVSSIAGFLGSLTEPKTWLRAAEGIGGLVLFMVGLKTLTRGGGASPLELAARQAKEAGSGVKKATVGAAMVAAK